MTRCPICERTATPRSQNPAFPFCSPRCKQVDLGKWLKEEYSVPASEESIEADAFERQASHLPVGKA